MTLKLNKEAPAVIAIEPSGKGVPVRYGRPSKPPFLKGTGRRSTLPSSRAKSTPSLSGWFDEPHAVA